MNDLNFEYVPLTFISNEEEIRKQIRNTLILIHLFEKYKTPVRLEKLIEGTQYGYNASALQSGKNKFLRISDIYESKVNWATVPFCNCEDANTYLLKKDDILVARTGGTTGKSFKIDTPPKHAIYAGYLIRIRAKIEVNPDYIYLFMHSFAYWSQIVNLNEKKFRPKANAENLKALILPNCPKNIQDEIIELSQGQKIIGYEDLLSKIEKTLSEYGKKKEIENLLFEQLAQIENLNCAILQEAVQGKLVPQNKKDEPACELLKRIKSKKVQLGTKEKPLSQVTSEEKPFQIPQNWVWCRLGDIILGSDAGKSFKCKEIPVVGNEWGVIKVSAVSWNNFLEEKNKLYSKQYPEDASAKIRIGDFIISRANTSELVGKSVIVKILTKNLLLSDKTIRLKFPEFLLPDFINLFNNSQTSRRYYASKGTGSSPSMKNITREQMKDLPIPLPPLSEQKRIVAEIEKQLDKTKQLKEQIIANQQTCEQLLKALLHKAFEVDHAPQPQIQITKSVTVNDAAFWQHQLIATYISTLKAQNSDMLQGEMGLVKYGYLDFAINKTNSAFTFRPWIFGPFTEEIKEILHSNTGIFSSKKVGNKGFEVYDLGKASDNFIDHNNPELKKVAKGFQSIVDVFEPFSKKERTKQLELVACVCWLIEKLQTTNITQIYQGMKDWPTPTREGKNKAEIFTRAETVAAIDLIKHHHWQKKLLTTI